MRGLADDAVLMSEDAIRHGMRLLHRHAGVVAEPSAAVGEHPDAFRGQFVGTVVTGGNMTTEQMERWL